MTTPRPRLDLDTITTDASGEIGTLGVQLYDLARHTTDPHRRAHLYAVAEVVEGISRDVRKHPPLALLAALTPDPCCLRGCGDCA